MTNEEKAKAYDEALERAKEWATEREQLICPREIVESIFPELRESEGERIRTFLLDYAIEMIACLESDISLSTYDGVKGHDPDAEAELAQWQKARAYLEKQKEQKPVNLLDTMLSKDPHLPKQAVKYEQKPAEWSEEDENKMDVIIRLVEQGSGWPDRAIKEYVNWLKSLHTSPKQEWSEELDIDTLREWSMRYAPDIRQAIESTAYHFYNLRPSWKPTEDEERLINTAISFLKDFADKGYENAVECIDWLKSKLNGNSCK